MLPDFYLHPSWQLSATLTVLLTILTVAVRVLVRLDRVPANRFVTAIGSFAQEFAVVMALLGLWQWVGGKVRTHSAGAMEHARDVEKIQNWLHLPDQVALQHAVLPHHDLVRLLNVYYDFAHLNSMGAFLIWVWWHNRERFRTVRNTIVFSTLICLLVQMFPVAPPRLLVGGGFIDTALAYGQSVYGPYATGLTSQLTAMPSVHVGWAFIVALYVARLGRGPLRWIGVLHLALTVFVVAATANHWWLDGIVAVAIVLVVMAGQWSVHRLYGRHASWTSKASAPQPRVSTTVST
jgi:hypothetical protein